MMNTISFGSRGDKELIEQGEVLMPKFDENGLIPVMAIEVESKEPLMLAYMNEEALKLTLSLKEAVYYSRSRQEIWHKGKTSGHIQTVHEVRTDCDQDALILYVSQNGSGACHTGHYSCFYRRIDGLKESGEVALIKEGEEQFDPQKVYQTESKKVSD